MPTHIAEHTSMKAPPLMPWRGVGNDAHTSPERSEPLPVVRLHHSVRQDKESLFLSLMPLLAMLLGAGRFAEARKIHCSYPFSQAHSLS